MSFVEGVQSKSFQYGGIGQRTEDEDMNCAFIPGKNIRSRGTSKFKGPYAGTVI